MEKFSIMKSMHAEHLEMEKMINQISSGTGVGKKRSAELLSLFNERVLKHMEREERAIYAISVVLDDELKAVVRRVFADHAEIKMMAKELEAAISNDRYLDDAALVSTLVNHHSFEDLSLYSRLDVGLPEEEKRRFQKEMGL